MEPRAHLERAGLVDAALDPDDVIVMANLDEEERVTPRCAICGTPAAEAVDLPVGYANPVCRQCDALAVNESGEEPWTGYPPDERPDHTEGDGVIHLEPDHGQNPVYIAGVKCWRRYRFGGHITRRDAYDCESLEEFQDLHRVQRREILAFNTPHPDGLGIDDRHQRELLARLARLRDATAQAQAVLDGEADDDTMYGVQETIAATAPELDASLPGVDEYEDNSYASALVFQSEEYLHPEARLDAAPGWVRLARLCERHARDS